jgi:hypothetical protein
MIICFNATPEAKKALDILVSSNEFRDISEAICVSITNYEVLHSGMKAKDGGTVVPTQTALSPSPVPLVKPQKPHVQINPDAKGVPKIPDIFRRRLIELNGMDLREAPTADATLKAAPPKNWLWGQYNRMLPVKATCRALFNLASENPHGVPLNDAVSKVSFAACGLGDFLQHADARGLRRREDAMSSAFPTTASDSGESRLRFGNQFVGSVKQGSFIGLPAALRLVTSDLGKDSRVLLTKSGAEFALLENPILDLGESFPTRKLSDEEIKFLLEHIRTAVPEEAGAYRAIVEGIKSGANTPDGLDDYLCERFALRRVLKAEAPGDIAQSYLTTQRTGAISRMADLNLVQRSKAGLHVTYYVTHPGEYFVSQLN